MVFFSGKYEKKRNGNWRAYFYVENKGVTALSDLEIPLIQETGPTPDQISLTIQKINSYLAELEAQEIEYQKPKYKFLELYQDLKIFQSWLETKGYSGTTVYNRTVALITTLDSLRQ